MAPLDGHQKHQGRAGEGEHHLFSFLICKPNDVVAPIHPKAMPVILTTPAERALWMSAPVSEALALQRPLQDDALVVMARVNKQDPPADNVPEALLLL